MAAAVADSAALAWPLALGCATIAAGQLLRARGRRRRLNRALHELRRPLQALTLQPRGETPPPGGDTQLTLALAALAELDRELNGGPRVPEATVVEARTLAEAAVRRWRPAAAGAGRLIELHWRAPGSRVLCEPAAIARALDNLIANALEHGTGAIRIEGGARPGHLRLFVCDGADRAPYGALAEPASRRRPVAATRWHRDPRRGHGLGVVAEVAAAHDGRFAACRHAAGASAVIELPLVE